MKEALLYKKEGNSLKCFSCLRQCLIANQQVGFCQTRKNIDGKLYSLYYGYFSGIRPEPLKSKPFLHFKNPKTHHLYSGDELTLSIGGFGCNFKCKGCQNAEVSKVPLNIEKIAVKKTPEEIINEAQKLKIKIIAFTWNEPAIMPEIVLEVAQLAQKNDIRTVYVSNGSPTKEHLDLIMPFIDAFRYDIKAGPDVGDKFYENYCSLILDSTVSQILEVIKYTKNKGKHIELLTVLIPGYASSCTRSILNTARWIRENLGAETPWHLAKFFPAHQFSNPTLKTPDAMIEYFVKLVKLFGLKNIHGVKDKGCDCLNPNKGNSCCS